MSNRPLLSVIIATRNEEKNIGNCIRSILGQSYKDVEIIVVDKGSSDNTVEIARSLGATVFPLAGYVDMDGVKNFRGAQVNLGARKAKGDIIFFPDADMTFEEGLLTEAVEKMAEYDALYIPEIVMGKGLMGRIRKFERSFYNETPIDAVRIVRKDIFKKVGGFDEKNIAFSTDDWDLTKMIKKVTEKISITKSKLYHNEAQISLRKYLQKKLQYADTFADYIAKWGQDDPDIKKQFGFSYRFFGVFWEKGKWRKLLCHPFLALGMYSLRVLVGVRLIAPLRGINF